MSDLYLTGSESKGFPEKGETDYLSPQEAAFVQRILRRAEVFPQEFWKAVMQKVALDGEPMPFSQISGFRRYTDSVEETQNSLALIGTTESSSDAGGTPVPSSGAIDPNITLDPGTYFCIATAQAQITDGAGNVTMQLYNQTGATTFGSQALWESATVPSDKSTVIVIGSVSLTVESTVSLFATEAGAGNRWLRNRFLISLQTG